MNLRELVTALTPLAELEPDAFIRVGGKLDDYVTQIHVERGGDQREPTVTVTLE